VCLITRAGGLAGRTDPVGWTGTSLIAWGGFVHPGGHADGRVVADSAVYRP
jgi:hypothetical protein